MLKVFIGYDHVESGAFYTLCHSINKNASEPVSITPLMLSQLQGVYTRGRDPKQSNDFSFTRFLAPYLSDYEGFSVFMDCDMLLRTDINRILDGIDSSKAVSVVKHEHNPVEKTKYLGTKQYKYEKKNWSSVMVFNNARCKALTPEYVNTASGLELHQFKWLSSDDEIGELAKEWNHLVGYNAPNPDAKIVHYTIGGPYFHEYYGCEYTTEWMETKSDMLHIDQLYVPTVKTNKKSEQHVSHFPGFDQAG